MRTLIWLFALIGTIIFPYSVGAQTLERTKNWEVGDKMTYEWTLSGKSMRLMVEVLEVTDAEVRTVYRSPDRSYDTVFSARDMSYSKGICLSNGQTCEFSPGLILVDFPLERGKKWSGATTVNGEEFISQVDYERKVEKTEKLKTPAGQFEAYKVSAKGRIKATDKKGGGASTGRENGTDWFAVINGKLVPVKHEYKNSYGEKFTLELVSAEIK